ncbi:MAG: 4-hydroxybenzoate octaprenyltransferase [Proteobacteria bacterium]|nr:4-hydroxybenzoate octaprenyltransferase [Pseudomonadota bacterium]
MRLHQPTGIWLLFLPCIFGILLATKFANFSFAEISRFVFLFFIGSVLMRSAGCVINDLLDCKFDELVTRTKTRPLAAKEIPQSFAIILLGFLLLASLLILLQFNFITVVSGFVALGLVTTYPLMKRVTYYPQIFLGLTFNFGILMASLAMLGKINFSTLLLYFSAIIWTVIYDTIYAFQDIEDDLRFGVKSTAIKFQKHPKKILNFLCLVMLLGLTLCGFVTNLSFGYFFVILLSCSALIAQIRKCDFRQNSFALFKANVWTGIGITFAILIG